MPGQPSPRFHVEAWLPFRNCEMVYWYILLDKTCLMRSHVLQHEIIEISKSIIIVVSCKEIIIIPNSSCALDLVILIGTKMCFIKLTVYAVQLLWWAWMLAAVDGFSPASAAYCKKTRLHFYETLHFLGIDVNRVFRYWYKLKLCC